MNIAALRKIDFNQAEDKLLGFLLHLIVSLITYTFIFCLGLSFGVMVGVFKPSVPWTLWSGIFIGVSLEALVFATITYFGLATDTPKEKSHD